MTPFYADDWLTLYGGDCRDVLASLPADSVDCVVTSPPYWGLRDYGTATWEGGDAECDHRGGRFERPGLSSKQASNHGSGGDEASHECRKCGATRIDSQLGLERTPEEYVANMVAVFREVRRVLKPSGTCWLNLGDSYAGSWGANGRGEGTNAPRPDLEAKHGTNAPNRNPPGLKPKDLVGIPWRVAFALQADGWYLRSDIIWAKPNPMPESVTDRPTKAHEYLFLLTKSARYYFDADAVREKASQEPNVQRMRAFSQRVVAAGGDQRDKPGVPGRDGNGKERRVFLDDGVSRNIRSVWTIATVPYGNVKIGDAEGGHRDTLSPDCPVHSLRAIRRSLRTDGDDALLDRLRSRSPRNGSHPAPMPADGLFANLDLDSPGSDQSTPDSLPVGSSPSPTPGSAHASRTPARPTSDDGQGSDAETERHTSHTPSPTIGQGADELSGPDVPSATGRSERENRTSGESEQPDSVSPEPSRHTPGTDAPLGPDEQRPHTSESSSAGDSARRDPAAQTDTGTSGRCTCPDYSASHFAVFPPELPERCIKAGCSEKGVCPECGAPWERVVERKGLLDLSRPQARRAKELSDAAGLTAEHIQAIRAVGVTDAGKARVTQDGTGKNTEEVQRLADEAKAALGGYYREFLLARPETVGWAPSCDCYAIEVADLHTRFVYSGDVRQPVMTNPAPAVVLDPFGGSGTVGMVANRLSRRAILIDLNPEYLKQQMTRNAQTPLGLTEGDAA